MARDDLYIYHKTMERLIGNFREASKPWEIHVVT